MNHKIIKLALAGNANVGKSCIFNQLTGLNQVIGNWPGKTVEKVEGNLYFEGYLIHVLDLPGTYSLSAFSIEEIIARDYIAIERPDIVVNVVDASALERNLYLTIQLLELETPVIVDLNQVDFAAKKGIRINAEILAKELGVPVVPTVAISGRGIKELLSTVIALIKGEIETKPLKVNYGKEVEERIEKIINALKFKVPSLCKNYPARWLAIKLLERDSDIIKKVSSYPEGKEVISLVEKFSKEIEKILGEPPQTIIASRRYALAHRIAEHASQFVHPPELTLEEKLDYITTHPVLGYIVLATVLLSTFILIFHVGEILAKALESIFSALINWATISLKEIVPTWTLELICKGVIEGISAGITIALPYIIPFYIILAILEDSGYLPRAAFLMDNLMHKIGLHGKAFIPLILGYGCSVPACIGCRIMETERERLLAGFVVILIPCAARTVIIMGLVARYIGILAALGVYAFNLFLVFILGRIAFKVLPGEPVGLIMEMPPYRKPLIKNVLIKTWIRTSDFVKVALPLIVIGSLMLEFLVITNLVQVLAVLMKPLIVDWLMLPEICGFPLIFGVLRKELVLVLLVETAGENLNLLLTPIQMIVFSLVSMLYIPCIATIATLVHEFGWKKATLITLTDVGLALFVGGISARLLISLI